MKFTVVTILPPINSGYFNTHLRESINDGLDLGVVDKLVTIMGESNTNIAREYNKVLGMGDGYYMFAHYDVRFSYNFWTSSLEMLQSGVGAVGLNGRGRNGAYNLDGFMICMNSWHGIRFDEKTFDGMHLYAEDYCCQARVMGLRTEIFRCDFNHASVTLRKQGSCWGDYVKYRTKLFDKWGKIKIT